MHYTANSPVLANSFSEADRLFTVDLSEGLKMLRKAIRPNRAKSADRAESADQPIDRAKVAELLRAGGDDTAAFRYEYCHEAGMGWVGVCVSNPNHEGLYHPFSCNDRACPVCSRRRSAQLSSQITKPIMELAQRAPRGYRLRHLVLTTDHGLFDYSEADMRDLVKTLRKSIRIMLQGYFTRTDKKGRKVPDKWLGGLIAAEFGEKGRKLHFHVLLLSRFVRMNDLLAMWNDTNQGHGYIGHIREVDKTAISAIDEVCKYATKGLKDSSEDTSIEETLARVHFVLKGVRRVQGFGVFYNMDRDDQEAEVCCPECGSPVMWMQELDWAEAQSWRDAGDGSLKSKPVNKLLAGGGGEVEKPPPYRQETLLC